jgi:hypothetical protein
MRFEANKQFYNCFERRAGGFWVNGAVILAFSLGLWVIQRDSPWIGTK